MQFQPSSAATRDSDESCPICSRSYPPDGFASDEALYRMTEHEKPVQLACGHVLGLDCMLRWTDSQTSMGTTLSCPLCRDALFSSRAPPPPSDEHGAGSGGSSQGVSRSALSSSVDLADPLSATFAHAMHQLGGASSTEARAASGVGAALAPDHAAAAPERPSWNPERAVRRQRSGGHGCGDTQ